eukprot:TRINITY_DN10965_c0_g2_i1.p1 TRINITY_DN10965_c0_g2~~TRINITY_DN10965_c0_g2_i1.p1  ORF type:complete len:592 (-),score=109.32 TRINITY_DN10965_c0_g2_i1:864-2639(-)
MVCIGDTNEFYEEIRKQVKFLRHRVGSGAAHVYVAGAYVDSLVALKILCDLFKTDSIEYSVFPVYGYSDIPNIGRGLQNNTPVFVPVFINCGGNRDLVKEIGAGGTGVPLLVLDSHRPIHLANVASEQVYIAWTEEDSKIYPDILEIALRDEDDDYADEDDDEDEYGDDGGDEVARKERLGQKRKRQLMANSRREYEEKGSSFGKPAGVSMYEAAHNLLKDTSIHLWAACVALTDQHVHFRRATPHYHDGINILETKVTGTGQRDRPRATALDGGVETRLPDNCRIEIEEELQLMCLPRWNLYASMEFSTYPCTKLQTWSDAGQKSLRRLFAEMGIKRHDACQKFQYMDKDLKRRLREGIVKLATKYELDDISFRCFTVYNGYKTRFSAADVVYGLTALLEASEIDSSRKSDNFWVAASSLSMAGWKSVEKGMDLAIKIQEAIVRVGRSLVTGFPGRKVAQIGRGQRVVRKIILDNDPDLTLLARPLALTKLVHFVKDGLKAQGKGSAPMVVAATPPGSSKTLVVGVTDRPSMQHSKGNFFGPAFSKTSRLLGVAHSLDLFEASTFELPKDQVDLFFLEFTRVLNSGSILT